MSDTPFLRSILLPGRAEADALFGFSLPFLPAMPADTQINGVPVLERLRTVLQIQIQLISDLWRSGIAAFDLRFVGTDDQAGVAIGLLCRVSRTQRMTQEQFQRLCQERGRYVQQLFADAGYELFPLIDEKALSRYLSPFRFQAVGEIRRAEDMLLLEDAYTEYEVYLPHPWQWIAHTRARLFEALVQRQASCLISICLEPTQLSAQEQTHLSHAGSGQIRQMLLGSGPRGRLAYETYSTYALTLHHPYVLRIALAAASPRTFTQLEGILRTELSGSARVEGGPIVEVPHNQQEWEQVCQSIFQLAWTPWGKNSGLALPGTARLRVLTDARGANASFRLPILSKEEPLGVPVRSAYSVHSLTNAATPTVPVTPVLPSTQPSMTTKQLSMSHMPTVRKTTPSIAAIQKPEDLLGVVLGNYALETLLGQGGCGAVYRAKQTSLHRDVAVKVVLATLTNESPAQRQKMVLRFDREAHVLARLDHPNILGIYEYQAQPFPYLVMPYVAGGSLADEQAASGRRPLSASGVALVLQQIASALDYIHAQHVVHRDMKPHNILRHADGRVLLSDFGIVQVEESTGPGLTTIGKYSPYTPAYASPEQHQELPLDHRSDIYSLGVIVYELLTGQRPFGNAFQTVHDPPPPMHSFGIQVAPALEMVVLQALAKQPAQRYQSAGEMAIAFHMANTS